MTILQRGSVVLCIGFGCLATDAHGEISGTLTLSSDYRFRGLSQDARSVTPQAELDWSDADGWSLGAFVSKVDFQDHEHTSIELDAFGGKHMDWGAISLDLNAFYYSYPNHDPRPGSPRYSTFEANAKLSRRWRRCTVDGALSWSPDFLANGESWDSESGLSCDLSAWLIFSGHLGAQWEKRWNGPAAAGFPYRYADLGATISRGPWTVDLRYETTTLSPSQCLRAVGSRDWCTDTMIATVRYAADLGPW